MKIETNCRESVYDVEITVNNKTVTQTRVYGSDWWRWQIGQNTVQWDSIDVHRAYTGIETDFGTALMITKTAEAVAPLQD